MSWYWFVLGALVTWRVTHLLNAEDGPWDLVVHLRRAVGQGFLGHLLDCFCCLSLWVSLPMALLIGASLLERLMLWWAWSAAAILLERVGQRQPVPQLPFWEAGPGTSGLENPSSLHKED